MDYDFMFDEDVKTQTQKKMEFSQQMYTPINQHSWLEYGPCFFDVVPMENGDIQGSYVSLPEDAMTVDSWDARL